MIRIFTGDDRTRASAEIKKTLGSNYEVIDCAELTKSDLPRIFMGTTIFDAHRRILLRDFTANLEIFSELPKYLDTPHDIILLETKLDKRTTAYKDIKGKVEIKEFKTPEKPYFNNEVFDIYRVAKTNGPRAVAMLRKIEDTEDPIRFTGLLISQAIKELNPDILRKLSQLDMAEKTTSTSPWLLVESFLLTMN